ncbi:MAG TPA: GreA/GreB family elongation factor [Candidatus Polarisedimenticolaceae bacterium]|nr:GreA/GreB family elongation factor [Candidatus Polarisedimenticolaceae bacterium]
MSKAFTKEDDRPEPDPPRPRPSPLPEGTPNYITPAGAARLKAELDAGTSAERLREIRHVLDTAVVLNPPSEDLDVVRFGATVTVRSLADGKESVYRIVGVDETDVARGWISWISPVAMALLNHTVDDRVRVALPSGTRELEILDVSYD